VVVFEDLGHELAGEILEAAAECASQAAHLLGEILDHPDRLLPGFGQLLDAGYGALLRVGQFLDDRSQFVESGAVDQFVVRLDEHRGHEGALRLGKVLDELGADRGDGGHGSRPAKLPSKGVRTFP
jgi:hypothetical protein